MCFLNGNSAPSCNPPLCSVSSLGCYFLSHIYLRFPCFFWASGVSLVSSGNFAWVEIATHCWALLCFQILLGLLSCSAHVAAELQLHHDLSLAGAGRPSRITMSHFMPPVQDISKMEKNALGG